LTEDLAIIQTIDFFTPIVDDPFVFGQIAVVNALNDVYAMGGKPLTAMNVVCFPVGKMGMEILREILLGGLDKMREADVLLVGGHSVDDPELKYGLSVMGIVHPEQVWLNRGAKGGDLLILTKPLGTGIVSTLIKAGKAEIALEARAIRHMTTLNKRAAELAAAVGDIHAVTDITGFGLLGHACEMIEGSSVGMIIYGSKVPIFSGIKEFVEMGMLPGGLHRNRKFRSPMIDIDPSCPSWFVDVLFDPQTAGGLLIALSPNKAEKLIKELKSAGIEEASIIGEVVSEFPGRIRVSW